jgi:hypothetical protein
MCAELINDIKLAIAILVQAKDNDPKLSYVLENFLNEVADKQVWSFNICKYMPMERQSNKKPGHISELVLGFGEAPFHYYSL